MKTKTNNGGTIVSIDRSTGNLLGAPNYPQLRQELWFGHKRNKALAYQALRCGDIVAAMGAMRCMHDLRVQIEQTRLDEYVARSGASFKMLVEESKKPALKLGGNMVTVPLGEE